MPLSAKRQQQPDPSPYAGAENADDGAYLDGTQMEERSSDATHNGDVTKATAKQNVEAISGTATRVDPLKAIARGDQERAEWVERRRQPANFAARLFAYVVPYGGIVSSGFNLASSTLGAGIIALPSAFNTSGMVMAIIYLIVVGVLTVYSFTLLAIVGKRTGLRNYEQITRVLLGPGADYFLAFVMWLLSFGAEVSYVISMGNLLKAFLDNSASTPAYLLTVSGQRVLTSAVWLVAMMPLCLPKEINSLRYLSVVAVLFVVFFVLCMIIHSGKSLHERGGIAEGVVYFQSGNQAVEGLAIFMFAFISQLNCYEVYEEMYRPSVRRLTQSSFLAVALAFTLYFCAGFFGYVDFGSEVKDSVLLKYNPVDDRLMSVGYAGIILKLCVGYGLHMIPVRDAIYHVIRWNAHTIPWWQNAVVCGLMATLSLIAGLFIPRINMVFGLVGGFSGGFIGYIFPALLVMYSGNWNVASVGWFHYVMTYVLLIVGVIGVVFGTGASIFSTAVG